MLSELNEEKGKMNFYHVVELDEMSCWHVKHAYSFSARASLKLLVRGGEQEAWENWVE